ncbi:alanine racemase [Psychrobacter sp.]|uniref:alanine racemase n=1 Tax=Psychrobacter sp. TaxID=56811 RepID=UPI002648C0C3|nr:alanine racemase [Psychrobacter sp.]MDN6276131.1 alanine racemase [Psychrobacter sp.]MDN6307291.1 alanine racemase [Psychrobacter sp.]
MRTITIKPKALTHNLNQVKKMAPTSKVLAMVKSNAYGHGIAAVLPALQQADGIGVATLTEALEARQLGWDKTIGVVEGVFTVGEWQAAIKQDISCVIHHAPQLQWALDDIPPAQSATRIVWLKYNTGMNRLGFDADGVIKAAERLHAAGYQLVLTTHFANADDKENSLNALQIQRFSELLTTLQTTIDADIKGSLCNSAGIVNFSDHHYDWVRPGIILYGSAPVIDKSADELNLQPAMEFSAQVIALQTVSANTAIGYGSLWSAPQDTKTALVSIGYGDGYPRVINSDAYVTVINETNQQSYRCTVLGRVAMDMIVIDVSDMPEDTALNSKVILWGDVPHVDEIAVCADTISYELLCRLSIRPNRVQTQ